jgi:5-methylcytosine-specific restriction endonuclease McrA
LGIDYKGNRGGRFSNRSRKNIYDYLKKDFSIGSSKLKIMLFKERVKEEKCENCNNFMWMGQKIPLELHHIDDDKFNNLLENLKILCSNCHSLVTKRFKRIQT